MENDSVVMELERADGEADSSNPVFCAGVMCLVQRNTNIFEEIVNVL